MLDPRRTKELKRLIEKLGLPPNVTIDLNLLDSALTHPSISRTANYEQLEFVGDAVVRLASSEVLLETYPEATVGEFAAVRSILVSDRVLASFGEIYGIDRYLLVSNGMGSDRAGRNSRLADAFEAILGALYLSTHTMEFVRPWLDPLLKQKAEEVRRDPARENYKDALQEWTQGKYRLLPEYRVRKNEAESSESCRFSAQVWLQERCLGEGTGSTKKAAEQAAAKQAFLSVSQPG